MSSELVGYQYVVLRCVPRVEREEFVNVGVVVYCQAREFLQAARHVDAARLHAVAADIDLNAVASALDAIEAVCRGDAATGNGTVPAVGTRFGFVSAPRSTVIQPGPVHGGLTRDPADELAGLVTRLVG
jgi:hypothetical protein